MISNNQSRLKTYRTVIPACAGMTAVGHCRNFQAAFPKPPFCLNQTAASKPEPSGANAKGSLKDFQAAFGR